MHQNRVRDQKSQSLYFQTRAYGISLGNMTTAEEIEMRISSVFLLGFSNYRFQPADERERRSMSTDSKARIYYSVTISPPAPSGKLQFPCLGLSVNFSLFGRRELHSCLSYSDSSRASGQRCQTSHLMFTNVCLRPLTTHCSSVMNGCTLSPVF